jgi:hypothetical protein
MRFEETYGYWKKKSFTQEEAAMLLGVSIRTFRRYNNRYEEDGLEGLYDRRLAQESHLKEPVDEVMSVQDLYRTGHRGRPLLCQVSMLSIITDGIIVGSTIVKLIEAHTIKQDNDLKAGPGLVKKVGEFIGQLKEATKTGY